MASLIITNGTDPIGAVQIGKTLYVNDLQLYKNDPMVVGSSNVRGEISGVPFHYEGQYTDAFMHYPGNRCAGYIRTSTYGDIIDFSGDNYGGFTLHGDNGDFTSSEVPVSPTGYAYNFYTFFNGSFSTNIPIFETFQDRDDYLRAISDADELLALKKAINYQEIENTHDTQDWYIYNTYDTCEITLGIVEYTGTNPLGRFEIIKADKVAGYYTDQENSLEFHLIGTNIVGSVYSSVNQYDVISKQSDPDNWTRGTIYYDGPFYDILTFLPDGSYTIGVTLYTNIPIFKDEQTALGFLDGTVPEEEAINYGSTGDPEIAQNESGQKETTTTFGGNESENVFSHDYMMTRTQLADIGGKFFDTSIWQALLDGLKIYGNNPMDSVLGCLYFPFDLSTIATDATAVTDIYFGSYKMENVSANKIRHRSGYKEMGSTFIKPTFYNWLDYKAQHVYLYLPYCGFVELDINKYLNKWLKVIYMVDLHSGECEISLLADGLLMDTYSGQIGIKQPITYNDLSTYFLAQVTALRNGAAALIGGPVAGAGTGAQMGANAGPYGAIAGAAAGATVGEIAGRATAMWTGYKVASTKPPLFSKGGYSSEIGANMPQYCFLVFMYNDVVIPENELTLYGKPSEKSGPVGSFNGFLSVNYVRLNVPTATETEKEEILSLLNSGIYI